ncbi:MAG TPA: hypothetical protein VFH47_00985 [Candidatus Thermoplasmatota archaeon]|nr:hypothetical protein [Candidatus Thermoplasmatota archaeon]
MTDGTTAWLAFGSLALVVGGYWARVAARTRAALRRLRELQEGLP